MIYDYYTIGGILCHSNKGTTWKNHKYKEKRVSASGKIYYVYDKNKAKWVKKRDNENILTRIKDFMDTPIMSDDQVNKINKWLDKNVNNPIRNLKRKREYNREVRAAEHFGYDMPEKPAAIKTASDIRIEEKKKKFKRDAGIGKTNRSSG